jgi:hypothetical protein
MKTLLLRLLVLLASASFAALAAAQTTYTFKPIAKFDYPGAVVTAATGIDSFGNVAGVFRPPDADYGNGFERYTDGTFSPPIIVPGSDVIQTIPTALNDSGTIAGFYDSSTGLVHGFFLKDGVFTAYDYPGSNFTMIQGINEAGDFVGYYSINQTYGAFASIGGNLIPITIPSSTFISPTDINNDGEIVGWYNTPNNSLGFVMEADGTLHNPIHPRGGSATFFGTSDKRYSVGQTYDGTGLHGLFYAAGRTFVTYDFPGVSFVELTGINNTGFICGHGYDTTSGMTHSYIVRVQASTQ